MEKSKKQIIVDFEPISRRISFPKERSLYEILIKIGIQIRSLCGGAGTCGKCKIFVQKGMEFLNPLTDVEKKLLGKEVIDNGGRLACQTWIDSDSIPSLEKMHPPQFRVYLPDELLIDDFNILTSGIDKKVSLNPNVKKVHVHVQMPSLEKPTPDYERILSSYLKKDSVKKKGVKIDLSVLKKISPLLRENDHDITLTLLNNNRIIECEPGNTLEDNFGIAFDIGTTTLVGYLMNLTNGKTYSIASKLNPQTAYGEDVISRMTFIKDNENGLQKLNNDVVNALNEIILKNCLKAKINPSQIYEATIVGNTVMHHIFLGIDPSNIAFSPFIPVVQQGHDIKAKELNLNIFPQGNVHTLPIIAGFVGADTIGVILSSQIDEEKDITLAIDIGTNGEIIIGNHEHLITGSCAAGSALEGAHIKDGMRAAAGSIDTIKIEPETLEVSYTTIKNKKPIGICGSGLIDVIAEMLKSKILKRSGGFNKNLDDHPRIVKNGKEFEFIVVKKQDTNLNRDISISQDDVRQIQMAKAAFYSGTKIMLNTMNLKDENINSAIKKILLAGAFGNYIDKDNAKFIGMIPDIASEKIYQIGNAAGMGAKACLVNKELRQKAQTLLKKIRYVEVAVEKNFQREYAEALYFPHFNLDLFPNLIEYANIPKI